MTDCPAPLILPNNPSDKAIVTQLARAIAAGREVVIWIDSPYRRITVEDYADAGMDIEKMIKKCTLSGDREKSALMRWQKIEGRKPLDREDGKNMR